jgi:hypothetical protein
MEVFMSGNCSCGKKICPVSLGLALGITCFLGYAIWVVWVIYYGPSAMMIAANIPVPTWETGFIHAFWAFVKGLVFGFFLALFYDFISCCCKSRWCCKKSEGSCCIENKPQEPGK